MGQKTSRYSRKVRTPVGTLTLVGSRSGLRELVWSGKRSGGTAADKSIPPKARRILAQAAQQLSEYFQGRRKAFTVPLDMEGTSFQKKVWGKLMDIPYGKTWSYGELAEKLGDARKARAVGGALNRNPVGILVPCHRVIGKDGSLTGFAGGLDRKSKLLSLESKPQNPKIR